MNLYRISDTRLIFVARYQVQQPAFLRQNNHAYAGTTSDQTLARHVLATWQARGFWEINSTFYFPP
jgi:hypothetical protein